MYEYTNNKCLRKEILWIDICSTKKKINKIKNDGVYLIEVLARHTGSFYPVITSMNSETKKNKYNYYFSFKTPKYYEHYRVTRYKHLKQVLAS